MTLLDINMANFTPNETVALPDGKVGLILKSKLYGDKVAVIDAHNLPLVNHRRWSLRLRSKDLFYVYSNKCQDGKWTTTLLHRLIANAPNGMSVDHINHDTLCNSESNLRVCTNQENQFNQRIGNQTGKGSRYKGVVKVPPRVNRGRPWQARINVNQKQTSLGYYATEEEAASAYDQAAKKYFGDFAYLNNPIEEKTTLHELSPK